MTKRQESNIASELQKVSTNAAVGDASMRGCSPQELQEQERDETLAGLRGASSASSGGVASMNHCNFTVCRQRCANCGRQQQRSLNGYRCLKAETLTMKQMKTKNLRTSAESIELWSAALWAMICDEFVVHQSDSKSLIFDVVPSLNYFTPQAKHSNWRKEAPKEEGISECTSAFQSKTFDTN
jgi:hypothetical protein